MTRRYLSGSVSLRDGNWYMRLRLPTGVDTRRKIGPAWTRRGEPTPPGHFTQRTARMELDKILSEYEGWTADSDPLFKFAAEEWLTWCETERGRRKSTTSRYSQILSYDLLPALGTRRLSAITEADVADLRAALVSRGISASSLNQTQVVLSGIQKYARRRRGYRGEDFSAWFDRAPLPRKLDIDVYSPTEVEQLARAARAGLRRENPRRPLSEFEWSERARMDDQDAVLFKVAAYAGLRLSEIRALRWRDVDFAGSKINVRAGYTDRGGTGGTKSGKARTVPMASRLAAELNDLSRRPRFVEPDDLVFCDWEGTTLSGSGIYHRFLDVAEAAELRRIRFHDLRHTFGTIMIQKFNVVEVKEMLGHASITTTSIYLHYKPRPEDAARMDSLLDASLGANDLNLEMRDVEAT